MSGDALDITLRALLERMLSSDRADASGWVNIRSEELPWRHIVAAAERGECEVSRVGRKLLMKREELNKFLDARRISTRKKPAADAEQKPKGKYDAVVQRALRRNGMA